MSWYLGVLKKYAVFSGRARRQEYWMFVLINMLIGVVLAVVDWMLGTSGDSGSGLFQGIYGLAVFIPALAVTIRRLHDIGKSGWFYLIILIPLVGVIWLLILTVSDGDSMQNQYGPNPKQMAYGNTY